MRRSRDVLDAGSVFLGGLAPIGVAAGLVSLRGHVANADIALVLVVLVVAAAAAGGRGAGALAAVVSTMAFDFFHTRPYLSLKITSAEDIQTTALLLVVGLAVGQMALIVRHRSRDAAESRVAVESLYRVAEQAARDSDVEHLTEVVRAELTGLLSLARCSFHTGPPPAGVSVLEPSGWMVDSNVHRYTQAGEQLPGAGLAIPVRNGGELQGHVLCVPVPGSSVPFGRRRVAITLADQFASALAAGQRPPCS
jgi:hypothetical protein